MYVHHEEQGALSHLFTAFITVKSFRLLDVIPLSLPPKKTWSACLVFVFPTCLSIRAVLYMMWFVRDPSLGLQLDGG